MLNLVDLGRYVPYAARSVSRISHLPGGLYFLRAARRSPVMGSAYKALLGYRRPFASLVEANAAVAPYDNGGHQSSVNRATHLRVNRTARPSDYAAMFHINRLIPGIRRVFDLGGNVGNLFYCYRQFLELPADLIWHVSDLPK